jgi:hypothetical protein
VNILNQYKNILGKKFLVIALIFLSSIAIHARIIVPPRPVSFALIFFTYGLLPGYLLLQIIEKSKIDIVELYANSFFLSICLFAPLAFFSFIFTLHYSYLIIIYDLILIILFVLYRMNEGHREIQTSYRKESSYYFITYVVILILTTIFFLGNGIAVSKGGDVGHLSSYVRKLAETPKIYPYAVLKDYNFINYMYSYNTFLLFLSIFAHIARLDTLYILNFLPAMLLMFSVASVYAFVLNVSKKREVAVFVSLLFPFCYGVGRLFELQLFRGYMVLPASIVTSMLMMVMSFLVKAVLDRKRAYIIFVVLGSYVVFSTHGQGMLHFSAAVSSYFILCLLLIKKYRAFLKDILVVLILVGFINLPYLYIAKVKPLESFQHYKVLMYEKKIKKMGVSWKQSQVRLSESFKIISPKVFPVGAFFVAVISIILLYRSTRDLDRSLFFSGCVFCLPFFLFNPLVVTYGERFITLNQMLRFAWLKPFVNIGLLTFPVLFLESMIGVVVDLMKRLYSKRISRHAILGWSAIIIPVFVIAINFGIIKNVYAHIFNGDKGFIPYDRIVDNALYSYLKDNVPARSTVFNLNRHYFPVTVVSNNFVTFPGNIRKHYFSSPPAVGDRDYKNGQVAKQAVLKQDFRTFFEIFFSYDTDYMLVPYRFLRRLRLSDYFRMNFVEEVCDKEFCLYKFVAERVEGVMPFYGNQSNEAK